MAGNTDIKIRTKLTGGFILMIVFMIVIGAFGYFSMLGIKKSVDTIFGVRLPSIDYLVEADRDLQQLLVAERSMMFTAAGDEKFKGLMDDYNENLEQSATRFGKYKALASTEEEKAIIARYEQAREEWEQESKRVVTLKADASADRTAEAIALSIGPVSEKFETMRDRINELQELNLAIAEKESATAGSTMKRSRVILVVVLLVGFMSALVISVALSRGITRNIRRTVEMLQLIAKGQGDLTRRLPVESSDELGELATWFNRFVEYLEEVIVQVKNSASQMDVSTQEVAAGAQGLSQATQEQASAIEEVAATIEEMTSSIKHNAENASDGRQKATEMVRMAGASGEAAQELVRGMSEISDASKKIGDIIVTVNEVAFQTNLLALNAAVEAARAGEHGKGFAVVAEEVRALAQRSAEASRQIKALIEDTVNKIAAGDAMVKKSGESLEQIIRHIQDLSQVMEEIAAASSEQASGVDELNRAIAQIDTTTQQNASTVEELASTSDNLSSEAQDLARTVSRFTVRQETRGSMGKKGAAVMQRAPQVPARGSSTPKGEDDFEEF